jgi:hypothetical protein
VAAARREQRSAATHARVAARWDSAATAETNEASAFAREAASFAGAQRWRRLRDSSRAEASPPPSSY